MGTPLMGRLVVMAVPIALMQLGQVITIRNGIKKEKSPC